MTNETKARQIAECCSVMPPTPITQSDVLAMTNNAAMQAMEWKDKELKNYLDELLAKLNACEKDRTREATIVEIIKGHFFKNVDLI